MVRFGVIGTSNIAKKFVRTAQNCQGCQVTAIYSRSMERAEEFAAEMGIEHSFDDLTLLGESSLIDAVYIASPNVKHCKQALDLLEQGKHVLCEKPLASNRRGVELMFHAARENHVILMEAMRNLHDPGMGVIRDHLIKLGRLTEVQINYGKYSSKYDDFLAGNLPNIFNREFSTGALMDMGVYCVEPLIDLFGTPDRIEAKAKLLQGGIDGEGEITAVYPEGFTARLAYSKITDLEIESRITGEKGTMYIQTISNPDQVSIEYLDGRREILNGSGTDEENGNTAVSLHPDNMQYEICNFVSCIEKRTFPQYYEQISKVSMGVMDEARRQCGVTFPADEQLGFRIRQLTEDIFHIDDSTGTGAILLHGSEKNLLFDTMSGIGNLKHYLDEMHLTPDYVINSHGHYDHTGGNHWFPEVYLHEADRELLHLWREKDIAEKLLLRTGRRWNSQQEKKQAAKEIEEIHKIPKYFTLRPGAGEARLLDIREGMEFDLGNSRWKVLEFPGHTPGSIGLWNEEKRILISGDAFVPVACLFFPESNFEKHVESTEKLRLLSPDAMIASHYPQIFGQHELELLLQCNTIENMKGPMQFAYEFLPEYKGQVYLLKTFDKAFGGPVGIITA